MNMLKILRSILKKLFFIKSVSEFWSDVKLYSLVSFFIYLTVFLISGNNIFIFFVCLFCPFWFAFIFKLMGE